MEDDRGESGLWLPMLPGRIPRERVDAIMDVLDPDRERLPVEWFGARRDSNVGPMAHVIKSGAEAVRTWCGLDVWRGSEFILQDRAHAQACVDTGAIVQPCEKCARALDLWPRGTQRAFTATFPGADGHTSTSLVDATSEAAAREHVLARCPWLTGNGYAVNIEDESQEG